MLPRKNKYNLDNVNYELKEVVQENRSITEKVLAMVENLDDALFILEVLIKKVSSYKNDRIITLAEKCIESAVSFDDWRKVFICTYSQCRTSSPLIPISIHALEEMRLSKSLGSKEDVYQNEFDYNYQIKEIRALFKYGRGNRDHYMEYPALLATLEPKAKNPKGSANNK